MKTFNIILPCGGDKKLITTRRFKTVANNSNGNIFNKFKMVVNGLKTRKWVSAATSIAMVVCGAVNTAIKKSIRPQQKAIYINPKCKGGLEKKSNANGTMYIHNCISGTCDKSAGCSCTVLFNTGKPTNVILGKKFNILSEFPESSTIGDRCVIKGNQNGDVIRGNTVLHINTSNIEKIANSIDNDDYVCFSMRNNTYIVTIIIGHEYASFFRNKDGAPTVLQSSHIYYNDGEWTKQEGINISAMVDNTFELSVVDYDSNIIFSNMNWGSYPEKKRIDLENFGDMIYSLCQIDGDYSAAQLKKYSVFEKTDTGWKYLPNITPVILPNGTQAFIEI